MSYDVRKIHDTFTIYELREIDTRSYVRICPERGGMVISYAPFGQEILFLDQNTFRDVSANVRGGIPVLWPICGRGGSYEWENKAYFMPNHGLVRQQPWSVVDMDVHGKAAITLRVAQNESTRYSFPFAFELLFTYELVRGSLHIQQTYCNKGDDSLLMYGGFHPYFQAFDKRISLSTDARHDPDLHDGRELPLGRVIDLNDTSESRIFETNESSLLKFATTNSQSPITITYGPEFKYVVLWTIPGQPFLCVEPWMALPGALQTKRGITVLEPHRSISTSVSLSTDCNG